MKLTSAFALTVVLAWSAPASACSCIEQPVATARAAATWVFEGVMLRAEPSSESGRQRATFRVERVWKGTPGAEVTIDVPGPGSMCPPHLSVGERVILYATGPAEAPRVESCARYAMPSELRAERRRLGPARNRQSGR
ncbi:MAG: hypothetical protein AB8I08_20075 [Sandaracinaceae bacterium]